MPLTTIISILMITGAVRSPGPASAQPTRPDSCYVAAVAVVWDGDSSSWHVRRVVTSGIRALTDDGRGALAWCTPRDPSALSTLDDVVTGRLRQTPIDSGGRTDRMMLRGTSLATLRATLLRVEASARSHPAGFRWLEIAAGAALTGVAEMPLRERAPTDRACAAANDSLAARHADYHWAC